MKVVAFKVGLTILATAATLLLCEAILRVSGVWVGRHTDTMFTVMQYDPTLGWKMKPGVQEKVSFVDIESIPVHANSLGFWDKEFRLQKDSTKKRIAFLGDSMTWGLGVQESERFSNVIERLHPDFESLNFGIPGFGNDQELLTWRTVVAPFRPDIVVLTVYSNDYADNMFVIRSGLRKPYFDMEGASALQLRDMEGNTTNFWSNGIFNEVAEPYVKFFPRPVEKRSRVLHWLVKHSDLARLGYTILRYSSEEPPGITKASAASSSRAEAKSEAELGNTERTEVHLMDALLRQIGSEVTATGATFLVVLSGEPNTNFDIQKLALQRAHIKYLDATTDVLAQRVSGGLSQLYFPYNKHWTAAGHRAVAEMISAALSEEKPASN